MDPLIEAVSSALDLLSDKKKWTQNIRAATATDENRLYTNAHYRVPPKDPKAVCWCISGAVEKFLPGDRPAIAPYMERFSVVFSRVNDDHFPPEQYNDLNTYPSVYAMLRRTYERLVLDRAQSTEITDTKS